MSFKKELKNKFLYLIALFVVMFVLRLGYEYSSPNSSSNYSNEYGYTYSGQTDGSFNDLLNVTNIASRKHKYEKGTAQAAEIVTVDQKYEKTGSISCKSSSYDEDEKKLNTSIENYKGIIQYQQKSGNKGYRSLHLQIGVPPEKFDDFINDIKANQQVKSISITQKDKTNEYRELNSRREALTNTRNSLAELKTKGGKIEEYVNLENRILEIDEQLRGLGVSLGSFDSENEFCTIKLTLLEIKGEVKENKFWSSFFNALEWTVMYYLLLCFGVLMALGALYVLLLVINMVKNKD